MNETQIPSSSKQARARLSGANGKRSDAQGSNGKRSGAQSVAVLPEKSEDARLRLILGAMVAFRDGDFSVRLPVDWAGSEGRIAAAFNQVISQKQRISEELARLSEMVG